MRVQTLAGGRYDLRKRVGSGGMADVFVARDTRLERDVAVKVFRPGTADGIERGSAEARLLAGLNHPGLVRVLDMDAEHSAGDGAYLVMEYVPGPDLNQQLRSGALERDEVRRLGLDLSRTLSYIHGRGVMHRDLKPSNILTRNVEKDSGLFAYLLTDFGIARFFDGGRMTATNQVIGSAAYFSPEQARGEDVGIATDVYSLGLVMIEALSGERAFPGSGAESALARLQRSPSIPLSAGGDLMHLLAAMTLDNPAARPNARDVVAALSGNIASSTVPTGAETPAAEPAAAEAAALPVMAALTVDHAAARFPVRAETGTEAFASSTSASPGSPSFAEPEQAHAPSTTRGRRGKPGRGVIVTGMAVLIALVVLGVILLGSLIGNLESEPAPLPEVPGLSGEKLEELYESVQP